MFDPIFLLFHMVSLKCGKMFLLFLLVIHIIRAFFFKKKCCYLLLLKSVKHLCAFFLKLHLKKKKFLDILTALVGTLDESIPL